MRKITLYLFHLLCNYELIFDFAFQRVTVGNYLMCFSKVRKTDFLTHHGITINMTIANMLNEIYLYSDVIIANNELGCKILINILCNEIYS